VAARASLLGMPLDRTTIGAIRAAVDQAVATTQTLTQASLNAAKVVEAQRNPLLRNALWRSDFVTADGQPIVWTAKLLGLGSFPRVAGIDLMRSLVAHAAQRRYSVYLLGAREEVVDAAARVLTEKHTQLKLAGRQNGYFAPEAEDEVVASIRAANADLLFLALGTPAKELFLDRHKDALGVKFAMGVGGAFDVVAGTRRRAPESIQRAGLEWAYRLAQDPRRLARRYAVGNAEYVTLVAREVARRRGIRG
jgi:N-acetylglucosaminyldiphosphoundecaprenol N-acetyl-beta-D-mannosaminyltransferase